MRRWPRKSWPDSGESDLPKLVIQALLALVETAVRGGIAAALVLPLPARHVACKGYRGMATDTPSIVLEVVLIALLITPPFIVTTVLLRRVLGSAMARALIGGAIGILLVFVFLHWGAGQAESACINRDWNDLEYATIAGCGGVAALLAHLLVRLFRRPAA
jgi:hypothetical protein